VSDYAIGYNITVVQEGVGNVTFTSNQNFLIKNRSNFFQMAGQYAVASLLRVKNTNTFLLYGDLI
jgi:predicted TIM-barrel enzyme